MATLQSQINILVSQIHSLHKDAPEKDEIDLEYGQIKTTFTKNDETTVITNVGSRSYDTIIFIGESGNYIMKCGGGEVNKKIYKLQSDDSITLHIILKFEGECFKVKSYGNLNIPSEYDDTDKSSYRVCFIEEITIKGETLTESSNTKSIIYSKVDDMTYGTDEKGLFYRRNQKDESVKINSYGISYPKYYVEFKNKDNLSQYASDKILITDIKIVSEYDHTLINTYNDISSYSDSLKKYLFTSHKVKLIFENISDI